MIQIDWLDNYKRQLLKMKIWEEDKLVPKDLLLKDKLQWEHLIINDILLILLNNK